MVYFRVSLYIILYFLPFQENTGGRPEVLRQVSEQAGRHPLHCLHQVIVRLTEMVFAIFYLEHQVYRYGSAFKSVIINDPCLLE